MIMPVYLSVKSFLFAGYFQLLDSSGRRELIKVAINCSQTDLRQSGPDNDIQLIRSGMRLEFIQFLKNYSALNCIA